jgi:hypothetical protein
MGEIVLGALISGAITGGMAIQQHQEANQSREDALKAAKVRDDAQKKLISDAKAKEMADKATAATEGQAASQKKKQGAAAMASRYSGGDGTATLLGGAGVPAGSGDKTLLGM